MNEWDIVSCNEVRQKILLRYRINAVPFTKCLVKRKSVSIITFTLTFLELSAI